MNPVFIGAAIVAAIVALKKKQDSSTVGGGALPPSKAPPTSTNTEQKEDASYLGRDLGVLAGTLGGTIGGGIAAIGGGSFTGGLATIGGVAGGVVSTLGLAIVPLSIVLLLILAGVVGARTAEAKSMAQMWKNYLPSARIMVAYETHRLERFAIANNTVVQKSYTAQDPRLEATFTADGQRYTYIGERDVWVKTDSAPNAVPYIDIQKALRAVALVYALECGKYANAMLRNWGPKVGSGGHGALESADYWLNRCYDNLAGYEGEKLGGLNQIPLPGGYTEKVRADPNQVHPEAAQLRAVNATPVAKDIIDALVPEAKFLALKNVLETIHFDNAVYLPFDRNRYALDVFNRMELDKQWCVLQGSVLVLPFASWQFRNDAKQAVNLCVDIVDVKDKGPVANWYQTLA